MAAIKRRKRIFKNNEFRYLIYAAIIRNHRTSKEISQFIYSKLGVYRHPSVITSQLGKMRKENLVYHLAKREFRRIAWAIVV